MDWFVIISFFISLLVGVTIHEAAHAWMGNRLGDPTAKDLGRISLNPIRHIDPIGTLLLPAISLLSSLSLMGWAKPTPYNPHNLKNGVKDELLIALAGPISNLLLAAALLLSVWGIGLGEYFMFGNVNSLMEHVLDFIYYLAVGNLILAFFNLLPIPPLDGATFLKIFLSPRLRAYVDYYGQYGFILLLLASFTPAGNILGAYIDTCVGFCLRIFGFV